MANKDYDLLEKLDGKGICAAVAKYDEDGKKLVGTKVTDAETRNGKLIITKSEGAPIEFSGEANVIEAITLNGQPQEPTDKTVNLQVKEVPEPDAPNKVLMSGEQGEYHWENSAESPGNGELSIKVGSSNPVKFTANQSTNQEVNIPEAASATAQEDAHGGLMTTADKTKLDGITELLNDGTTGQVLTKTASGNEWANAPKELPTSGSEGQFLKKTANGVEYASVNEVPSGGTTGQVLTKTASGEAWADAPKELPTSGTAGQFLKKTENGVEYASVSEVPSGGTTGQVLIKTANGVEWGNSEVIKFTGTLNPDAVPPDYSGMPSAADVKAAIQAGKHVILSLDDTTGHPVQYFYTHSHGDFDFYFVGFPRMNAEGTPIYNRTYISAVNTIQSGPDSMGWNANKYLFADWPLNDGGNPTGNAGDVLTVVANQYGTKSMTWATPSAGLPSGGTNGQVLTKTDSGNEWADAPKELPTSGSAGQFLKKSANGVEYASVNQVPTSGMNGDVLKKTATGYEFSSANEVPANGTEGDVLTKGAEGYSWAPRMLYKYDSKLEGDTVEITNKSITRMNIDVHSATTFNITTDDVTNMPNAIVEIFVDPGTSLTEIAFTLTWTITSGQYAGVRTLYCPASGNTVQVNAGDRLQIHIYDSCWNAFRFIQPVSPTPSYEYVVLQNFVAGHSIGTPTGDPWKTTMPNDWLEDFMYHNTDNTIFVNKAEGEQLIDNRKPLDFSKYGISSGTPVAALYPDYNAVAIEYDNSNISAPLTVETFFANRMDSTLMSTLRYHFIMNIGCDWPRSTDGKLNLGFAMRYYLNDASEYYLNIYLTDQDENEILLAGFNPDGVTGQSGHTIYDWMVDWHHYAISMDATNLYAFVDGKRYATVPLSTTYTSNDGDDKTLGEWIALMPSQVCVSSWVNTGQDGDNGLEGLWAQLAVCKACKWATDFTVPTEAY